MSRRLRQSSYRGNPPPGGRQEIREREPADGGAGLLSPRSAGILGASIVIAACAGCLAYLAAGDPRAGLPSAFLVAGATFGGAVKLLIRIIA
jgi:hypothetical protein